MQFLQLLISGVAQGCIYGLIALGFVLIYKATETVSFAQGELMMLGAFGGLVGHDHAGLPLLAGRARCHRNRHGGLWHLLLERVVIRPILGQPAFSIVMLTIGIGYVARGLITMIPGMGTDTNALPVPYKDEIIKFGGDAMGIGAVVLNVEHLVVIACGQPVHAVRAVCLHCFATASWALPCRRRRKTSSRPTTWAFRCSGSTGSPGAWPQRWPPSRAFLLAPITFVHANMGLIGLKAFPAAVVGGFGSLPGAIVGGLVIGLVESFAGFYLPDGFKDTAAYIVVLLMLMVKPNGLFGEKLRKKV